MEQVIPFFSVVIPVYNREKLIVDAVNSILTQTFTNFEIVIVDDASTDATVKVIEGFTDKRVRLVKQLKNQERGAARNRGIEEAYGKYICFLDSDDRFESNHLENFYRHIEERKHPVALFFSNVYLEDVNGNRIERPQPIYKHEEKFAQILRYTFNPTRVCVHKEIVHNKKFDVTIPGIEDFDLWLRIAVDYPVIQLFEFTCVYLDHPGSYTSGDEKRFNKELVNFNTVFTKPELRDLLPSKEKNYLFSKCHYHLSIIYAQKGEILKMYKAIVSAFFLYPAGYNVNANKTMLVLFLYNIPVLGFLIKKLVRFAK